MRRMFLRLTPHVELPRLLMAVIDFVAFVLIAWICCFHWRVVSIIMPRYLQVDSGRISPCSVGRLWFTLMRLRALVKWVSWNFSGAKTDACRLAQRFVESKAICKRLQVSSVLSP